jgi:hypothetical protein
MQSLPKSLFLFVFCLPLAIVLGVMLATPLDRSTLMVILGGFVLLLTPFFLTSHHSMLILSWNAFINAFFLPGQPYVWMLMTAISIVFIVLIKTLNRGQMQLIFVPSVAWPLIILSLVIFITAHFTGGIGLRAIGSEVFGGKRYVFEWAAVAGFFAISVLPIPPGKRQFLAAGFFLSSITAAVSNVAFMLGERFYFLFLLFPVEWAVSQLTNETAHGFSRVAGLAPASVAAASFFLLKHGVRGTFHPRYPWRAAFFLISVVAGLFSGFRVTLVLLGLLLIVQFLAEGLHKTRYIWIAGIAAALLVIVILPFANRLPLSVQRCLTIFPLDLDRAAAENAQASSDWRVEMWRAVIPDIPKYFWLGKGYALDPKDLYFAQTQISRRIDSSYEGSMIAGDYHNGPLSVIIPFGIWGVLPFVWFLVAGTRLLWKNYKYGDPEIVNINRFLFVAFVVQTIFFLAVFGSLYVDLAKFVGIVALSISINGGVAGRATAPVPVLEPIDPEPEPTFGGRLEPAFRGGRV